MGKRIKNHVVWLFSLMLVICILTGCAGAEAGRNGAAEAVEAVEAVQDSGVVSRQPKEVSRADIELTKEIDGASVTEPETAEEKQVVAESDSGAEMDFDEKSDPDTEIDIDEELAPGSEESTVQEEELSVQEDGRYTSKEQVALYLHIFGHLPDNYITKKEAEELGWDSRKGNLDEVVPGMSIGGSRFGNYEGLLPDEKGRKYYECDIDYEGGYRGAKRLIYSNDGLIFYTEDHYKTFEQLY